MSDRPQDADLEATRAQSFTEQEPGRKGEILDAALDVFSERGYSGGSMREIATRVGVSEPALYRHFSGKEEVFVALMRIGATRLRKEVFALIGWLSPEDIADQLAAAFADRRRAMRRYDQLFRAVLPRVVRNQSLVREFREGIAFPVREQLIAKAIEIDAYYGVANADETRDSRVRVLMALFVGTFMTSLVLADEPDRDAANAAIVLMGWVR